MRREQPDRLGLPGRTWRTLRGALEMSQGAMRSTTSAMTADLVSPAISLGARSVAGWTPTEEALAANSLDQLPLFSPDSSCVTSAIRGGEDPLGDRFCQIFSNEERRPNGATYTPQPIVDAMLAWAEDNSDPVRVVGPGAGSARFLVAAGRRFPHAELVAVELDPLAAILARGHLAAAGLAARARVVLRDYREIELPKVDGQTLFLGSPPFAGRRPALRNEHSLAQPRPEGDDQPDSPAKR